MADEWKDLHTFANSETEVLRAIYFENIRQNYLHIREPRFAVQYGKITQSDTVLYSGVTADQPWVQVSTTYIDPVVLECTGRDVLVVAQITSRNQNGAGLLFSVRMDGVAAFESATSGMYHSFNAATNMMTMPLLQWYIAPSVGQHTFTLYQAFDGNGVAANAYIDVNQKLFLAAIEI